MEIDKQNSNVKEETKNIDLQTIVTIFVFIYMKLK